MSHTVSCHCGASKVEITTDPTWLGKCHCIDCQKLSGSGYMPFACYPRGAVSWSGNVASYRSSERVLRYFCDKCGSPMLYHADKDERYAEHICVLVGLFGEQSDRFNFNEHIFVSQKRQWDGICDDLPQK